MSSLVKRNGKWTATARLPDSFSGAAKAKSINKTFVKKTDARLWLASTEAAMKLGTWIDPRLCHNTPQPSKLLDKPFKELLESYRDGVTIEKKGAQQETAMLNMLMREPFSKKKLSELIISDFTEFRDEREKQGKSASTIRNNLNTISAVFEWLIHEKATEILNPIASLRKRRRGIPQPKGHRERRLCKGEEHAINSAISKLSGDLSSEWSALFPLLLDTGMRLGEALSLKSGWLRKEYGFVVVPDSKNNSPRYVALSDRAYNLLITKIDEKADNDAVFRLSAWTAKNVWRNEIRIKSKCPDLRIHDLRHEALSAMANRGADLKTLMRQSGHKTVAVLMRYLNPTPEEQRARLFQ